MAGRRDDWQYESDTGRNYIVRLDNSNSRALAIGYGLQIFYPPFFATEDFLPVNITMRYVIAFNRDVPRQKRVFPVGYKFMYDWLYKQPNPGLVTAEYLPDDVQGINTAWYIKSFHGEIIDRLAVKRP
jgi:hypothetical protein